MAITIGSLSLDDSYAPYVNIGYEYYKTSSQEIIGGVQIITISGTVTVGDSDGAQTGSIVMGKLKNIRDLGKTTSCVNISIPGAESPKGKITNVSIEQGSDPSWVNQGSFSIELKCPISTIPENSHGITADDCVREFNKSESLQFGEESHGYSYSGTLSKSFLRYTSSITVQCENFCKNTSRNSADMALAMLKRMYSCAPTNAIFNPYKSYVPFLENRSLQINSNGSISFSCSMILVPPTATYPSALIDISVENTQNYTSETPELTKKISGTITGLVSVPWGELVSLSSSCSQSKFGTAYGVYIVLAEQFKSIGSVAGPSLNPERRPNCPTPATTTTNTSSTSGGCVALDSLINSNDPNNKQCTKPKSISVTKQYSEGVVSFIHEWGPPNSDGTKNGCSESGADVDTVVEYISPQISLAEHIIPNVGTLLQNLQCTTSPRLIITTSTTTTNDTASCQSSTPLPPSCSTPNIGGSLPPGVSLDDFILIQHTINRSKNSYVDKKEYIQCRA